MRKLIFILFMGLLISPVFAQAPSDFHNIIRQRRAVRSFTPQPIALDLLKQLVEDARFAPSAHNRQPWEFIIVNQEGLKEKVFQTLGWYKNRKPDPDNRPTAYVILLGNPRQSIDYRVDCAFAAQNIMLGAWAEGIGSCPVGSVDKKKLKKLLNIPKYLDVFLAIPLGYPNENPKVAKLPLEKILHTNTY